MGQALESRVRDLKSRLDSLRQLYADTERPLAIDLEIQIIQQQIDHLIDLGLDQEVMH